MTQLDLHDLGVLTALRAALDRFSVGAQEALGMAEDEMQRTREWVEDRIHHWQRQTDMARREVIQANDALRRCLSSGRQGEPPPNCNAQAHALRLAEAKLHSCQENLQTAQRWRTRLAQAFQEYQREARRLHDLATAHTDKARASLSKSAEAYEKVWQAARMVGIGINLGAGSVGIGIAAMNRGVNLIFGRANQALGDAGESIAQQVTADELGLKVVQFDRRQHGFDGILQGPNGQYLLLESKTSEDDTLHLAPDSYGYRQASAAWVAHVAQLMSTPGTELYSETNAKIGQTILQIGAEQVPMLGVVTNKQTNKISIYLRAGDDALAKDWLLISDDNFAAPFPE
jgi:hypothetical protein